MSPVAGDVENLGMIDKLGSPDTYNHYPTGWAVAFSTPYRMFKRYSGHSGGTADPLVIHWPRGHGKGRVAPPASPLHGYRADHPGVLRRHHVRHGGRREADSAAPRSIPTRSGSSPTARLFAVLAGGVVITSLEAECPE